MSITRQYRLMRTVYYSTLAMLLSVIMLGVSLVTQTIYLMVIGCSIAIVAIAIGGIAILFQDHALTNAKEYSDV